MIIFIALAILVLYFADAKFFDGKYLSWLEKIRIVFMMECVAVLAFAVSWLEKGKIVPAIKKAFQKVKGK